MYAEYDLCSIEVDVYICLGLLLRRALMHPIFEVTSRLRPRTLALPRFRGMWRRKTSSALPSKTWLQAAAHTLFLQRKTIFRTVHWLIVRPQWKPVFPLLVWPAKLKSIFLTRAVLPIESSSIRLDSVTAGGKTVRERALVCRGESARREDSDRRKHALP